MAVRLIRPPETQDKTRFLRMLYIRTERLIINEITRKRDLGYVDYAEAAALERVQHILQDMSDEVWNYVPEMIEKIFYKTNEAAEGYKNARTLTIAQQSVVQQLSNNLLGEISEAAETAFKTVKKLYTVARLEKDPLRETALKSVILREAEGTGWAKSSAQMKAELQNRGITAFVDKAGRKWSLTDYCNMATRTTAGQAQVAALLTADDWDLWQIVKIGSTCPVCAPLEGRVYSKSGMNPDYPPLSLAFGKIDPDGPDDLTNTYLNIHPNCLHSFIKYTTIGKTEKQIQRDKDFSDIKKNPITRDPRTKKQIEAYRTKERSRRQLISDIKQHREYRAALGSEVPKDFDSFRKLKYNNPEKWRILQKKYRNRFSLQQQLPYIWKGERLFIPTGTALQNTKTIAGAGSKTELRIEDRLISQYGGQKGEWKKKVAKVESDKYIFDIHWYERNNRQYGAKIKMRKDR